MLTYRDIQARIHPVPQRIEVSAGEALRLTKQSKFFITCTQTEQGPIKTAVENLRAFVQNSWEISNAGLPIKLSVKAEECVSDEGYRLELSPDGIEITGFSPRGLLYGTISLQQLLGKDATVEIPTLTVTDWPDKPMRGYRQESRWGSNVMEREDWYALVRDVAFKKMNALNVTLYCCWNVQYDGRMAEYLYFPVKEYPQLQTPMTVKYYSPKENRWIDEEILPPMFRENFFGDLVAYGQAWGVDVFPIINSLGHNTHIPRLVPNVSPKDENGNPANTGFCTSEEETYRLLFGIYDRLIDECLLPNGVTMFGVGMDEVRAEYATDPARPGEAPSPWCQCAACAGKTKQEIFIGHAIRLLTHLKEKGMKSVFICYDMLLDHPKGIGDVAEPFTRGIFENDLQDMVVVDWWYYYDTPHRLRFRDCHNEFGLRSVAAPWNGYYNWSMLTNCTKNIQLMAGMSHRAQKGEGMFIYSSWDRNADRLHDCFADYCWNYEGTQSPEEAAKRYALRHFAPMAEEACSAFALMEQCTQQRKENKGPDVPAEERILSNYDTLYRLCYYPFSYFSPKQPYPRHFPGEGLVAMLPMREDYERILQSVSQMAEKAAETFRKISETNGCERTLAMGQAFECENYKVLCEDWLAFLQMHDLNGKPEDIAKLAEYRWTQRYNLMAMCEENKPLHMRRGAAMREHSVFLQTFRDIADAAMDFTKPEPDILDITPIMSKELRNIR